MVLLRELLVDAVGLLGLGSVCWGCYSIYEPSAYIVGGACLMIFSVKAAQVKPSDI